MKLTSKADAVYARYSSHAQDDGTSIEVQVEQCERSAGGKCTHYIDKAKTGRTMGGRDALLRLLSDAEAGKIGRVFVYKFDRLGRNAETHLVARQLEEAETVRGVSHAAGATSSVAGQEQPRNL